MNRDQQIAFAEGARERREKMAARLAKSEKFKAALKKYDNEAFKAQKKHA
jgi:hypothetical protein